MPPLQFALTIDEADDFYRTDKQICEDGHEHELIKMERALERLRALGPVLQTEVTATLLAIFFILAIKGSAQRVSAGDIVFTDSSTEYVGTHSFVPPTNDDGTPIFLDPSAHPAAAIHT
jgi:hypothetical protein